MPRGSRIAPGGLIFHVLNRGNGHRSIFEDSGDYAAFERVISETPDVAPMRILASWQIQTAKTLGLQGTFRERGRPRKS